MRKLFSSLLLVGLSLSAAASTSWNLGGTYFTVDTLYHATVGPGITQTQLKVWNSSYSNNLIYTTIDLTTPNLELRGVQAKDNGDVVENVRSMGDRKNGQGKGQYITGTNADFFNMGGSPTRTCGHSFIDSHLYNAGYEANAGWSSYAVVQGAKDISFSESVWFGYSAKKADGTTHAAYKDCGRYANYLCVYTSAYGTKTGTNGWGSECQMKLISGNLSGGTAVFEVTTTPIGNLGGTAAEGNLTIPSGGYVLSGVGDAYSYVKTLKVGDRVSITMTATVDGKEIVPTQIVGGCPIIVQNGAIAPASNFTRIDHFSSRQARTAIGYNKDKTKLIMLVDDKFTTNNDSSKPQFKASAGLTMKMLAYTMMQLNCYNAMAFDGGGSSQLYVKGLGICNVPYGSTALRSVANGFFAVSTTPVDNTVAKIEVVQKNVKLSTGGTITPKVYGYNKYGVMVNTNLTGFTITLNSKVGSVSGTKITAGSGKYNTYAIIKYGNIEYEMPLTVNGGGTFISSVPPVIVPEPEPEPEPTINLTTSQMWIGADLALNDGWDATAPNWSSATAIKAKECPRFATAMNGKFYAVNMKTMSIMEVDAYGHRDVYKLPSLAGRTVNGVADYYGTAISHDDAGNFLIGHYFTKEMSSYVWTVYSPATGKAKHFTLTLPTGFTAGRIDCVGRVIGDLTKDAYVYIAPAYLGDGGANQKVNMVHFAGNGDVDNVTATSNWSPIVYLSNHNATVCQPLYSSIEEMNKALAAGTPLSDTFTLYSKSNGNDTYSCTWYKFNKGVITGMLPSGWTNYAGTNGFDTFTLEGKRFYVMNYQSTQETNNTRPMDIAIVDEKGKVVSTWKIPGYKSCYGYGSVIAQQVNDKNVDIYIYNCTYSATGATSGLVGTTKLRVSSEGNTGYPVNTSLTKLWSYVDTSLNDGWDATAPNWNSSTAIKSKECPRFATAMNGKIYSVNMKTMSIMEFDGNGHRDVYKLPALTGSIDGVADYYGTAITHDDAGNFLVGHYFTKNMSSYVFTVYSPKTGKAKNITLAVPAGTTVGRIDCIGRVYGDLTSGALLYIAPAAGASQKVAVVNFKGDGNVDNVTASVSYIDSPAPLSSYVTVCQPAADPYSFYFYSKKTTGCSLYKYEWGAFSTTNLAASWKNYAGTNGFDTFVLDGKTYYVVNYLSATDANNTATGDFAVLDDKGNVLASWKNTDYKSTFGYASIAVEPVNSTSVNIYAYNCTYQLGSTTGAGAVAASKFRFSIGDSPEPATKAGYALNPVWSNIDKSLNDGWDATAPNWSSATAIKAKECPRFATALDGKIYSVNMKTMSIMEFDGNGHRDAYKLPALTGSIDGVADYYGTAISHDDAGNFIVGHYFTKAMSSYVFTVYSPKTGKAKNITLAVPAGMTVGRIDCIGRVYGDLTRDARFYIAPASSATKKVMMVTVKGDGNVDNITASCLASPEVAPLSASLSICQPTDDGFLFYSKTKAATSLTNYNGTMSPNLATAWTNVAGTNGFDTFVLNGRRYYAVNYQATANAANTAPMDVAVLDEEGEVVAIWKNQAYNSCFGYSSIVAEPVDEYSARIYVYNCTYQLGSTGAGAVASAELLFSTNYTAANKAPQRVVGADNGTTGIEAVESVEAEGKVEYYNLQGVKVTNPTNGLYIRRQGNKTTKVLVR